MRDSRKDLPQVQKAKSGFKKATLVGVLALFFTFSFSSRALAQDYDNLPAASTFINTLKGTEVGNATTTDRPTNDESKIFFLYNEESGKFLNLGGYWGSHVVVSDVPRPFWIEDAGNDTYYITSKVVASDQTSVAKENNIGNGNYVGWATNNKTTDKDPLLSSYGVFASLPKPSSGDNSQFAWHFEKVDDSTNKYHIYLNLSNVNVPTVTKDAIEGNPFASTTATITWGEPVTGTFYLEAATSENVYGDYNQETKKYPTDPNYYYEFTEDEQTYSYCKYPGAEAVKDESPSKTSEWKLISLQEYKTLFDKSYKELTGENTGEDFPSGVFNPTKDLNFSSAKINVSYLLHDPDFLINNPELNQWKYRNAEGANVDIKDYISVGFDGYLKKATGDGFDDTYTNEYTDINGKSKILTDYQISNRARRMGLQVKETYGLVKGEIYQTIQITKPGLYTLSANYDYDMNTTQKPSLFVRYNNYEKAVGNIGGNTTATYKKFYYLNEKGYSIDWPNSYGFPMYNALAGHHNGYLNFFISPKLLAKKGGSVTVEFGMIINHIEHDATSKPYISTFANANENSDDTSNSDDVNYSWSVIDNFQLSFRGQAKPDLILDEDEENLDYVEKTSDSYNNLRLHRTFSTDKWNSIILPVGLTKEQYTSAFGDAPLAELRNLTQSEIQFETVTDNNVNDNNEYWLKPMTPYIIKANKANGGETEKYKGYYNYWDEYITNANDSVFSKTIDGENKPYFLISNVKMANGIIPTTAHKGTDYEYQNKIAPMWNFKGLTAKTNTTEKDADGNDLADDYECPYVVTTGSKESNKASIAAFGTLARNYTYTKSDGTTSTTQLLIAGRPSLKESYAMSGNKLTYYSAGAAMKGFRCWFEYTTNKTTGGTSSAKPMPTLLLDGVNMATGIDEIMANDEGISMISQYQKGIFSLGGQRISQDASSFDALPKGIYIVNGKKVIKD